MNERSFFEAIHDNPINLQLLDRLRPLALGACHLVAGCLFQAVWNRRSGWAADRGVKDYDVFYFDDADLSAGAEEAVAREVLTAVADLGIRVDVKNQARVHLWYGEKFGPGYPQLVSARDGIDRYLVTCTCVGIAVANGELYAPYGLEELSHGVLRMNPANPRPDLFREKAASYRARWPWLRIADRQEQPAQAGGRIS